jgi:hypothetical protein
MDGSRYIAYQRIDIQLSAQNVAQMNCAADQNAVTTFTDYLSSESHTICDKIDAAF